MYCTNCGAQIADNSKYCSNCGTKTSSRPGAAYSGSSYQALDQIPYRKPEGTEQDAGFLIGGIVLFAFDLFWTIIPRLMPDFDVYYPFLAVFSVLVSGLPIVFAIYTKRQDYKTILFITGALLMLLSIYNNYLRDLISNLS
jgi:hypothetical protein